MTLGTRGCKTSSKAIKRESKEFANEGLHMGLFYRVGVSHPQCKRPDEYLLTSVLAPREQGQEIGEAEN